MKPISRIANLILSGGLHGFSISHELYLNGVENLIIWPEKIEALCHDFIFSNSIISEYSEFTLAHEIDKLCEEFDLVIVYPKSELQIHLLQKCAFLHPEKVFLPFANENFSELADKWKQYGNVKKLGFPCIETYLLSNIKLAELSFPCVIKPRDKYELNYHGKRIYFAQNQTEFEKINEYITDKNELIVNTQIINKGNIVSTYVAYKSKDKGIIAEFTGNRISCLKNDYEVFATIDLKPIAEILEIGRKIAQDSPHFGIFEIEFMMDERDGKYKFLEINFRSTTWIFAGQLLGLPICYAQFCDATNKEFKVKTNSKNLLYVNLKNELMNFHYKSNHIKHWLFLLKNWQKIRFAWKIKNKSKYLKTEFWNGLKFIIKGE